MADIRPIKNGSITTYAVETLLLQPDIPDNVKSQFKKTLGQINSSEEHLWREVASRMTLDAFGYTPEVINIRDGMESRRYSYYRKTVAAARNWFLLAKNKSDREQVFEACSIDLEPVVREVQTLPPIRQPAFVRTPTGKKGEYVETKLVTA